MLEESDSGPYGGAGARGDGGLRQAVAPGSSLRARSSAWQKVSSMRMSMDIKLELAEELSAVGLSTTMDADIIQSLRQKPKASLQMNSFMDAAVLEMYSWTQDGTQYIGISADGTNWQKTKAVGNPGASSAQALDPSQMECSTDIWIV